MRTVCSSGRLAWVIAAWAVCGLVGCGGSKTKTVRVFHESGPPDLTQSPVIDATGQAAQAGLEVSWLVSTADRQRLASTLIPYLNDQPPIDSTTLSLWGMNGLRIVRVPLSDWPGLSRQLKLSGATQRQWINQTSGWIEIIRGPDQPRGQTIALDAERLDLGPGRLRMLSRCWLAPVAPSEIDDDKGSSAGVPAQLVVELVPQHFESDERVAGGTGKSLVLPPRAGVAGDKLDAGLVFSRLMLRMSARGGPISRDDSIAQATSSVSSNAYAYLLIPERPGVDWRDFVAARPESDTDVPTERLPPPRESGGAAPRVGEVVRGAAKESASVFATEAPTPRVGAGPTVPSVPTLGEALFGRERGRLAADGSQRESAEPNARALVVLIPRAPATYQLVAPVTAGTP